MTTIESLFKKLSIEAQEVKEHNFLEISNLITNKYRKLALKFHSDKTGGSDEKMQTINGYKTALLKYIKPLSNGGNLILTEEKQRYTQLMSQGNINWDDKRSFWFSGFIVRNLITSVVHLFGSEII